MASKVAGNVNAVSLGFKWEINNFCISCSNVGNYLESPKFTTSGLNGNIQWHLRAYPKGDNAKAKNHLSIFLFSSADIKAVKVNFKLLNNEGKVVVNMSMTEPVICKTGRGYGEFVSRDVILNPINGILNDDKITIVCEIIMAAYEDKEEKLNQKVKSQDDLHQFNVIEKYEALFENNKFSDVSLISEGKIVKVHKSILANSSSVFAAMFDADMKESQENTVEIVDVKYDVLVEMIRYIYAGKVNNIVAGELAVAADKYALERLKDTCEMSMTKNLNVDSVIDFLQFADKLRMEKLKEKAIEFIIEKGSDVTDKPEFKLLSHDIICQICRSTMKKYK